MKLYRLEMNVPDDPSKIYLVTGKGENQDVEVQVSFFHSFLPSIPFHSLIHPFYCRKWMPAHHQILQTPSLNLSTSIPSLCSAANKLSTGRPTSTWHLTRVET